jgi:ribosome assembly protein YihI (activator of Der GTPase)
MIDPFGEYRGCFAYAALLRRLHNILNTIGTLEDDEVEDDVEAEDKETDDV